MMEEKKKNSVCQNIADDIRQKIQSGEWKPGQKLPGERELCTHYGVARGTLKAAFAELHRQGLIRQLPGSGTYAESRPDKEGYLEQQADHLVDYLISRKLSESEIIRLGKSVIE